MGRLAALVFDKGAPITVGGLTLTERAILLAGRAGLAPVYVWGSHAARPGFRPTEFVRGRCGAADVRHGPARRNEERRSGRGGGLQCAVRADAADCSLEGTRRPEGRRSRRRVPGRLAASDLPDAWSAAGVLDCTSVDAMAAALAARGTLREIPMAGMFGRRVTSAADIFCLERDYIRHLNGGKERKLFHEEDSAILRALDEPARAPGREADPRHARRAWRWRWPQRGVWLEAAMAPACSAGSCTTRA